MITNLVEFKKMFPVSNEMYWKQNAIDLFEEIEHIERILDTPVKIIGTHVSKSITLPVIEFDLFDDHKSTVTVSNNFYVTTVSYNGIPIVFENPYFFENDMDKPIPKALCYGFNYDKVYTCYRFNNNMFTFYLKGKISDFVKIMINAPLVDTGDPDIGTLIDPELLCTNLLNRIKYSTYCN